MQQVEYSSWFDQVTGSFKRVLFGLLLFVMAVILLFWNEGRSVTAFKSLAEGRGLVVSVTESVVSPEREGKLVHLSGRTSSTETLEDPLFGLKAEVIKLRRRVEMFQWRERSESRTERSSGGGKKTITDYYYDQVWSSDLISSAGFYETDKINPKVMAVPTETFRAKAVMVGAYRLSESLLGKLDDFKPVVLPPAQIAMVTKAHPQFRPHSGGLYKGLDPASPRIGDERIQFEAVDPGPVSIISEQAQGSFRPFKTSAGNRLEFLYSKPMTAKEMFDAETTKESGVAWILRIFGFLLMFGGLMAIFSPLVAVAQIVPLVGDLLGAGIFLFSLLVSVALSSLVIALAWVLHRPLVGLPLVAVALASILWLKSSAKTRATKL